jgi:hypothetical protein
MGTGAFKISASSHQSQFIVKSGPSLKEFDAFLTALRGDK